MAEEKYTIRRKSNVPDVVWELTAALLEDGPIRFTLSEEHPDGKRWLVINGKGVAVLNRESE
jgi:hypothetical protein